MERGKDILFGILLNLFFLATWFYKMIVTSDIPVSISFGNLIFLAILLVIGIILYIIYTSKTNYVLGNIVGMLIMLFLWFMSMEGAIRYHYHKYDTTICILGFIVMLICFLSLLYNKRKHRLAM